MKNFLRRCRRKGAAGANTSVTSVTTHANQAGGLNNISNNFNFAGTKKVFTCIVLAANCYCASFGAKTLLTPDLVVKGGYISHEQNMLLPEKIGAPVDCAASKDDLQKNIMTFIFLNKSKEVMEKNGRFVFAVEKLPVGAESLATPVGMFYRSKSEISFIVTIDVLDSGYKYEVADIKTNRRVERVDVDYLMLANKEDIGKLKDAGFDISTITIAGIDLPTKGSLNEVHRKRLLAMVAERNGYVNLCIKQGKTVRGLKSKWVEKIQKMDTRIAAEIQLYKDEQRCVADFIKSMNEKIAGE